MSHSSDDPYRPPDSEIVDDTFTPVGLYIIVGLYVLGGLLLALSALAGSGLLVGSFGLLTVCLGLGLYRRINWVRIIVLVFASLSVVTSAISIVYLVAKHGVAGRAWALVLFAGIPEVASLLIGGWMLYYLTRPRVRALFDTSRESAPPD